MKPCRDKADAEHLKARLNKARQVDRTNNKRIYSTQPDHFLYDNSEFYSITVRVVYDEEREIWFVRMEKKQVLDVDIEEIPDDGSPIAQLPYEAVIERKEEPDEEDEFGLPEEVVEPSPPRKGRDRRF